MAGIEAVYRRRMARPRVSVFLGVSLDQRLARPDGSVAWLEQFHDASVGDYGFAAFFASVDVLVMGRATFDTVLGFPEWPYGDKRLVVFSHRAFAPPRVSVERAEGTLLPVLERLHGEGVRHAYLDGGQLVQQGLREGVVDALTLSVVPLLLGSGRPLFGDGLPETAFRLEAVEHFKTGLVQLRYSAKR